MPYSPDLAFYPQRSQQAAETVVLLSSDRIDFAPESIERQTKHKYKQKNRSDTNITQ